MNIFYLSLSGPGLAIRILCVDEPYIEADFADTQLVLRILINYADQCKKPNASLHRVQTCLTDEDRDLLLRITSAEPITATLLPIQTVGVQVRSFIRALESWKREFRSCRVSLGVLELEEALVMESEESWIRRFLDGVFSQKSILGEDGVKSKSGYS